MWHDIIENSMAIKNIYVNVPDLSDIELRKIELYDGGPTLHLFFDLPEFPDIPPKKWRGEEYNTVYLEMVFSGIENLKMTDWTNTNLVNIKFNKKKHVTDVTVTGNKFQLSFITENIRIAHIRPYIDKKQFLG